MYKILFFVLLYFPILFSQNESHSFDLFTVILKNNLLTVKNLDSIIIYQKKFNEPTDMTADLDDDGVDEYLVTDAYEKNGSSYFTLFIYNTIDTFYLADSIFSGLIEPYLNESEDLNGKIIISGKPQFDFLNSDTSDVFIPIDCWKFSDGKVELVNYQVYDAFISENDNIIDYVDKYYKLNTKDCNSTKNILAAIAAAYVNYLNASENAVGSQFLESYYFCKDVQEFKSKIINLMKENQ